MAKKEMYSVDFKLPRQFLGIEGNDDQRVYLGLVNDVPASVVNSSAFGLYKKDETVLVVGQAQESNDKADESEAAKSDAKK